MDSVYSASIFSFPQQRKDACRKLFPVISLPTSLYGDGSSFPPIPYVRALLGPFPFFRVPLSSARPFVPCQGRPLRVFPPPVPSGRGLSFFPAALASLFPFSQLLRFEVINTVSQWGGRSKAGMVFPLTLVDFSFPRHQHCCPFCFTRTVLVNS